MFVSSSRASGFFCLFFTLSLVVNTSYCQLVDDTATKSNGQPNPKINSIKKNRLVQSGDIVEQPVAGSDSIVLGEKLSTSLNKKYETQSAGTSGSLTPTPPKSTATVASAAAANGSKKCEYNTDLFCSIKVQVKCDT